LAAAAAVTNYLGGFAAPVPFCYSLAVNAGDTVVWVNAVPSYEGTSHVESYGGEFNSPPLAAGDVFSYTFTNAGYYAYRTGVWYDSPAGTVAVAPWTSAPPAIAINSPVEGEVIRKFDAFPVLATVASADNVAEIQYFANSALVGVATNPAYGTFWLPASATLAAPGAYVLEARAVYRQGGDAWSQPITLSLSPYDGVCQQGSSFSRAASSLFQRVVLYGSFALRAWRACCSQTSRRSSGSIRGVVCSLMRERGRQALPRRFTLSYAVPLDPTAPRHCESLR
jgi:hypothetical protein